MQMIDLDFTRPSDGDFFGITVYKVADVQPAISEAERSGYVLAGIETL